MLDETNQAGGELEGLSLKPEENDKGRRALRLWAPAQAWADVQGLKTVVISMTQWGILKINWFHAFFPRNDMYKCIRVERAPVCRILISQKAENFLCWLYNQFQGCSDSQRDDARQQTHIAVFYRGPLIAVIYAASVTASDPGLPAGHPPAAVHSNLSSCKWGRKVSLPNLNKRAH